MPLFYTAARSTFFRLFFLMCSAFTLTAHAQQTSTGWLNNPNHPPVDVRYVVTGQVDELNKTVEGFLEVKLSDDWKTYWRSPGEGGIAPSIKWDASTNVTDVNWLWPYPKRFSLLGIETLGYKERVVFPITLHVEDMNAPVVFKSTLTLSSCTTVCVLTDYPIDLSFVPSELLISDEAMHIHAQGVSQVPKASPLIQEVTATWDANQSLLQVTATKALGWKSPNILVDGPSEAVADSAFTRPIVRTDGDKLVATLKVTSWLGEPELSDERILITIEDEDFVTEIAATAVDGQFTQVSNDVSIGKMFVFALIGGLILNIMPCVLPVLGMKLSSAVSASSLNRKQIRLQFLASSSGIIVSFLLIATFLAVLKLTGSAVGWGIQFQSGWFIGLMILITALFGANMLGLFEIRLSSNTNTWLASKGDDSYAGHFTQGMFATLLATPCSAPFLGTAVAFALATNTPTMFAIFFALGLGMALPWILVALFPSIALALPKPGAWMNKVKTLFGVMMLLTSVWLLTLLTNHIPVLWLYVIAIAALVTLFVRVLKVHGEKAAAWTGGAMVLLLAGGMILASVTAEKWASPLPSDPDWVNLSTDDISTYVAQGKTVFVDVTADWCITCKANKVGVILQDPVYSTLQHADVIPMKGDWTRPSENVTSYLQSNGRFGVPFNIVYGPAAPNGIPLPVVLSSEVVIDAIRVASGG
ncbi:protein-disulfide reductase DsbD domain-containing protein [Vibrio sp. 10N.261.55.A7]|uniref:protein-disulfide reductase DsbD family protein n=1 Tax=Vibrio sp. 10N.261.55.A7 TaxID=1880851 RepID=UPI000C86405C|nr:protein-disulfide reductase DsbD domain-containing protein [Vibrio sp. 10N.261.55.A7]PMJ92636.1 cytochrome C biogenesis protein [Vibrio sp. 10N.261.55.A7]